MHEGSGSKDKGRLSKWRKRRLVRFLSKWPAHIWTIGLVLIIAAAWPVQAPLILYKAGLTMVGACVGYWLDRFFFERSDPTRGDNHRRWQLVVLMCAGIIAMSMGA